MGSRLLKTALVAGLALVTYNRRKRSAPLRVTYPEATISYGDPRKGDHYGQTTMTPPAIRPLCINFPD